MNTATPFPLTRAVCTKAPLFIHFLSFLLSSVEKHTSVQRHSMQASPRFASQTWEPHRRSLLFEMLDPLLYLWPLLFFFLREGGGGGRKEERGEVSFFILLFFFFWLANRPVIIFFLSFCNCQVNKQTHTKQNKTKKDIEHAEGSDVRFSFFFLFFFLFFLLDFTCSFPAPRCRRLSMQLSLSSFCPFSFQLFRLSLAVMERRV